MPSPRAVAKVTQALGRGRAQERLSDRAEGHMGWAVQALEGNARPECEATANLGTEWSGPGWTCSD